MRRLTGQFLEREVDRMWFTADTHFGHANIIHYSSRPFTDVPAMDSALIDRWNETVRPTDEVFHLGDVVMGRPELTLPLVSRLHGRLRLVPGNHDRCWSGQRKDVDHWMQRYEAVGFTVLGGEHRLEVGAETVLLCHFPHSGDSHDGDRYADHRPQDDGGWLLHGHVHERWRKRGRQINVGVDVWDYRPVHADRLAELIAAGPARLGRFGMSAVG